MQTGAFTNAAATYYAAPQQLNNGGQIIGHNHVVIEQIPSLDSTQPTNPRVFAFFKGLNSAAAGGQLTADVTNGLPAGSYKISTITTAANHQAVLVPVAQRGSVDDAVYVCWLLFYFTFPVLTSNHTSSSLSVATGTTTTTAGTTTPMAIPMLTAATTTPPLAIQMPMAATTTTPPPTVPMVRTPQRMAVTTIRTRLTARRVANRAGATGDVTRGASYHGNNFVEISPTRRSPLRWISDRLSDAVLPGALTALLVFTH